MFVAPSLIPVLNAYEEAKSLLDNSSTNLEELELSKGELTRDNLASSYILTALGYSSLPVSVNTTWTDFPRTEEFIL